MKILFSYIFDEEFERVYECFTEKKTNNGIAFKDLISNQKFIKGERFDEENNEFIAIWKDYYELKMIIEDVKKEKFYKTYTFRTLSIDKVPTEISLKFNYFWNSVDEKTIFILEFMYQDEFFGDLFNNEFNESDKIKICTNVEIYLKSIVKGLEISNSTLINSSFENIWKYISNPKILFSIFFKDLIIKCKDEQISLDSEIFIYGKEPNSSNIIPLIKLVSDGITIFSQYRKLTFVTPQKLSIPNHKLTFIIKLLDKDKTIFSIHIKITESISHEVLIYLRKLWKKKIILFSNFFESKNKKTK